MLAKYKCLGSLGSGSFGHVYEVINIQTGQIFAMKKIPHAQQSVIDREINVMIRIRHPNILRVFEYFYDIDEDAGFQPDRKDNRRNRSKSPQTNKKLALYIIMEHCNNGDLFAHISRNKGRNYSSLQTDVLTILKQIVQGCLALTQKGILHRDIKPENILLSGKIIKIADFGCAKLVEFMNTYRYTSNSFNIGTPMYSAPEILNMEAYDERCDVWSVGVILYFMVYETVPFLERNIHLLKSIITERTRGNNLTLPNFPQISKELKSLLRGMLQYRQEERLTWGQIINSRLLNPKVGYPELFVKYLIEVGKVIAWIIQSLIIQFRETYPGVELQRMAHCCNVYLEQNYELAENILIKNPSVAEYFKEGTLQSCEFSEDLRGKFRETLQRFRKYLTQINYKTQITRQVILEEGKSGRYYLWRAQKKARRLIAQSQKQKCHKRSLYCLIIISGFDRFLGEQHYLTLKSHSFIADIKNMARQELSEKIDRQIIRII